MLDQDPARRADFDREQAANRPILSQITALVPDQSLKTPFSQEHRLLTKAGKGRLVRDEGGIPSMQALLNVRVFDRQFP